MKVLYLGVNALFMNPTVNLEPELFRTASDRLEFYGPGYTSGDILAKGLRSYLEARGDLDLVIVGASCASMIVNPDVEGPLGYLKRFSTYSGRVEELREYAIELRTSLASLEIPRIVSLLFFDYYAASSEQIARIREGDFHVLAPSAQFVSSLSELPQYARTEKHFIRKSHRITDVWRDFSEGDRERIITATHFVDAREFCYMPLSVRDYDIAVPGVEYVLRKRASESISREGFKVAPKHWYRLFRVLQRMAPEQMASALAFQFYNLTFQDSLRRTKTIFTARGGFGIPIRKFFEVPAAGALLFATPCLGYDSLGYKDGRDYIRVEDADQLPDLVRNWLNSNEAQEVASTGRATTQSLHSLTARAAQIRQSMKAMLSGTYKGSDWIDGSFRLL